MKKIIFLLIPFIFACNKSSQQNFNIEVQKLKEADIGWMKACESKDVSKMIAWYDKDAFFVEKEPIRGIEDLTNFWKNIFSLPEYFLTWQVEDASVSTDGNLGYTSGLWQQQYRQNGELIETSGRYLAVWHKQPDGKWKVLVDKP